MTPVPFLSLSLSLFCGEDQGRRTIKNKIKIKTIADANSWVQTTFPKRIEDTPAYHNWPGENLKVVYGEGIFIGYRHYERAKIEPLFPFGHGLSYTTFEYGRPSISSKTLTPNNSLEIIVAVSNLGDMAGSETVQLYVRDEKSKLPRPEKELAGFEKVFLEPGETRHIRMYIDKYSVGYYDTSVPGWIAEEGAFTALVGASSADVKYVYTPRDVEKPLTLKIS